MLMYDEVAMVNQRLYAFSHTTKHNESLIITCNKNRAETLHSTKGKSVHLLLGTDEHPRETHSMSALWCGQANARGTKVHTIIITMDETTICSRKDAIRRMLNMLNKI